MKKQIRSNRRMRKKILLAQLSIGLAFGISGCAAGGTTDTGWQGIEQESEKQQVEGKSTELEKEEGEKKKMTKVEFEKLFETVVPEKSYKGIGNHNPVMTQRFGADPYAMVYDGRVYLYMTCDEPMLDEKGDILENNYSNIYKINVISSADLVNWTDHGSVYAASQKGAATWGNNSWAPAAACKEIDGEMKFFLYFANSGNGIAVLTSDSPTGPFTDPLGEALISRETPTCAEVTWLFDPAVLMDDDGSAYIYFGGGIPSEDKADNPGTARVAKLGEDMISLDGDPIAIDNVSYLFEDSGINKINGTYYYSYCSNFSVPNEKAEEIGFYSGEIITMSSENPMGPFTLCGPVLKNPQYYFGRGGNNHHCMFEFEGQWYMSYHARLLEEAMGINKGYRSTNIDKVTFDEEGRIEMIQGTEAGVEQVKAFHPYERVNAATMGAMAGIETTQYGEESVACGSGEMIVTGIHDGSWIGIYGADFGTEGAKAFTVSARGNGTGCIKICVDSPDGEAVGYVELNLDNSPEFTDTTVQLAQKVTGKHDIYFVFCGENFELESWYFN